MSNVGEKPFEFRVPSTIHVGVGCYERVAAEAARVGGGEEPLAQRREAWQRQARYLSTINLSSSPHWNYTFKTPDYLIEIARPLILSEPMSCKEPSNLRGRSYHLISLGGS